jgi:hypothetical protein
MRDGRRGLGMGGALLAFLATALVFAACDPGPASRPTPTSTRAQGGTAAAAGTAPTSSGRPGGVTRPTLVLDPNGFDLARFGDPPQGVITALTDRLGKPDSDIGWRRNVGLPGPCLGGEPRRLRAVRWRGLRVYFSDGATQYGPKGTPHFNGYWLDDAATVGRARIATAAGITIGSTVAQLKAAYGARRIRLDPDISYHGPSFAVRAGGQDTLVGGVSQVTDAGRVTWIYAGAVCVD